MPKVLKNLKVTEVSILTGDKLPANGESVIIKDKDSFEIIAKADKCVNGLVYCTVMKANTLDSDSDETEPETILKAAHDFMKNSRFIDENHNHSALDGVHVVQSYIDESDDWKAVFDVSENAVMLEKAKKGEITGVSIYGKAQKIEKAGKEFNADNAGMLKQIMDWLKSKFDKEEKVEKGFNERIIMQNWWNISEAFTGSIREIMDDIKVTDKKTAVKKQVDDFKTYLDKIVLNTNEIQKNKSEGQEMTKDEFKAMAKECGYEPVAKVPEAPAVNPEVETLKSTVKTLTETVEKQAKTIEEIAKTRTTDTDASSGEITPETICKCADPVKQAEMLQQYKTIKLKG